MAIINGCYFPMPQGYSSHVPKQIVHKGNPLAFQSFKQPKTPPADSVEEESDDSDDIFVSGR